ncbi:hypothetical protein Q4524_19870 [Alteromonas stellipolaris]|uniref:hypothetical protein n=1 Tax=Alteromonadales TaxID=135622 RepID=UPI001C6564F7|nr:MULTISPECIES: hypothetical protein [Alteromonadales]MDO6540852.1 hypothetical protein [Alteromonas stellipolaris]QYJ76686.1 hypothetical protein K0H79_06880 [Shewanella sp. FJAT-52076]
MKIFLKLTIFVLVALFAVLGSLVVWYDREQHIDFLSMFPESFETCHGDVSGGSGDLAHWFSLNKDGWKNHPASLAPGYLYKSSKLNINVHPDWVVVSYLDNKNWQQVIKYSQASSIFRECRISS